MHANLIIGDKDVSLELAWNMAKRMLCKGAGNKPCGVCPSCRKVEKRIHPDVLFVERADGDKGKTKKEIIIDQIRALEKDAPVLPNDGDAKVYILPEADTMNEKAQNAFLKILEEPPSFVSFILCAQSREKLLPTIRSRCGEIRSKISQEEFDENTRKMAEDYIHSRVKREKLWRCCVEMEKMDSAALAETVACIRETALRTIPEMSEQIRLQAFLAKAERYLQANVGTKHVTGYLSTYIYDEK